MLSPVNDAEVQFSNTVWAPDHQNEPDILVPLGSVHHLLWYVLEGWVQ